MTIEAQADFITSVQRACRKAKDSRKATDLETARKLMDSPEYLALPKPVSEDLAWAYAGAVMAVTGGGIG